MQILIRYEDVSEYSCLDCGKECSYNRDTDEMVHAEDGTPVCEFSEYEPDEDQGCYGDEPEAIP